MCNQLSPLRSFRWRQELSYISPYVAFEPFWSTPLWPAPPSAASGVVSVALLTAWWTKLCWGISSARSCWTSVSIPPLPWTSKLCSSNAELVASSCTSCSSGLSSTSRWGASRRWRSWAPGWTARSSGAFPSPTACKPSTAFFLCPSAASQFFDSSPSAQQTRIQSRRRFVDNPRLRGPDRAFDSRLESWAKAIPRCCRRKAGSELSPVPVQPWCVGFASTTRKPLIKLQSSFRWLLSHHLRLFKRQNLFFDRHSFDLFGISEVPHFRTPLDHSSAPTSNPRHFAICKCN